MVHRCKGSYQLSWLVVAFVASSHDYYDEPIEETNPAHGRRPSGSPGHVGFRAADAARTTLRVQGQGRDHRGRGGRVRAAAHRDEQQGSPRRRRRGRRRARLQRFLVGFRHTHRQAASLVVDPPDGRIPPLTDEARERKRSGKGSTRTPKSGRCRTLHPRVQLRTADGAERVQQQHAARADAADT